MKLENSRSAALDNDPPLNPDGDTPQYVVGIGASAGGLEALERFFRAMPPNTGLAFVVIQHLSPDFKSLMDELLARFTSMKLVRVEDPVVMKPNTIYLLPPRKEMVVEEGRLVLKDRSPDQQLHLPISRFFSSLAREMQSKAVAVVLSGTGSDGSLGAADVHDSGGLVLVQSVKSAKFDGMPRSALSLGIADGFGTPEELSALLLQYLRNPALPMPAPGIEQKQQADFDSILESLLEAYGIDFSHYKSSTIIRRIERRLPMAHVTTLLEYGQKLLQNPDELDALYRDLLIGVTRFFRDPEAFELLRSKVIPELVSGIAENEDLRVWVPGCATGEEVYSLGMLILSELDRQKKEAGIKIFATDVHRDSLRTAANGIYAAELLELVPLDLRNEFFTLETNGSYRVSGRLRKIVLFSPQNLLKDVPFNKIDFISCRNLLIYFQPAAQQRAISSFHFALKLKGVLFLGPSESMGELERDFEVIDRSWKMYRKITESRLPLELRLLKPEAQPIDRSSMPLSDVRSMRIYDQMLSRFLPASILVNDRREAVHLIGKVRDFLTLPIGRVTQDVLSMCEGDLRVAVSSVVQNCLRRGEKVVLRKVNCPGHGENRLVDVVAEPFPDKPTNSLFVLVQFIGAHAGELPLDADGQSLVLSEEVRDRVSHLESELQGTRESMQSLVEELETTNEELQASNEELLASNEELQSTNEELHSVNEELYTVNAEHEEKIRELNRTTNDLKNLMRATEFGVIFLDSEHRIQMFTPMAANIFNLLPQDVGRDIKHITRRIRDENLTDAIQNAISNRQTEERQVVGMEGERYQQRVMPYLNDVGKPVGVVLTYVNVTELTAIQQELKDQKAAIDEHAIVTISDAAGKITYVNDKLCAISKYSRDELLGQDHRVLNSGYHPESFFTHLWETVNRGKIWKGEFNNRNKLGANYWVDATIVPFMNADGKPYQFVTISTDLTERKKAEEALRENEQHFRLMVEGVKDYAIYQLDQDGRVLTWNKGAERLKGFRASEVIGKHFSCFHTPEDIAAGVPERVMRSVLENGRFDGEGLLLRQDGTTFWAHIIITALRDEMGKIHGYAKVARDISEKKKVEEEKARMESKLSETAKWESLGLLAGGVAHDFNNILAGILGNTEIVQAGLPQESKLQPNLNDAKMACLRAGELCKQLLAYAGKGRYILKNADLSKLALETLNLIRLSISKRVEVLLELSAPLPLVKMDETQIRQVIMNLVINASEAIGEKQGTIKIRTLVASPELENAEALIVSSEHKAATYVCLEVEDSGCGISPENLKRIFTPFFTTKFLGRGLGLAAALGIVRSHNAFLSLSSELHKGTRFRLFLPTVELKDAIGLNGVEMVSPRNDQPAIKANILVVDDEPVVLRTVCSLLERAGFTCDAAETGMDALVKISADGTHYDLVLLDLSMPGLSGLDTFEEIRKIRPGLKVILISGYSETEIQGKSDVPEFAGFIQKPVQTRHLIDAIRSALSSMQPGGKTPRSQADSATI